MADSSTKYEKSVVEGFAKLYGAVPHKEKPYTYESADAIFTWTGDKGKGNVKLHDMAVLDKNTGKTYYFEIKDSKARSGESDIRFNELGKISKAPRSKKWYKGFDKIIELFNANYSYLELNGHNFSIPWEELCIDVVKEYYAEVDYYLTRMNNFYICIPAKEVHKHFDYSGSEIRAKGKNLVIVFTPQHLKTVMANSPYFIEEDENFYIMSSNFLTEINGRGGGISDHYNAASVYRIEKNAVSFFENNTCKIMKKGIKECNGNLSVHTTLKKSDFNYFKERGWVINND